MARSKRISLVGLVFAVLAVGALGINASGVTAQPAPGGAKRIALVIGEAAYRNAPLISAANDAGLVADTLRLAGFDVTGAANLDQDGLRRALKEFVDKAGAVGPDGIAFVYLSGRALQYAGDNYLAPVDATIPRPSSVPLETVRLNDYLRPLAEMPLKARIVVIDGARTNVFAQSGAPLASGLALVEADPNSLYAFNAAPGSVAPDETGPYGVYAQALTEMLREGGLPLDEAFARVRLRVSEQTKGAQVPWEDSKLSPAPALFARAPGAPPPAVALETQANLRVRPIRDFPVAEAFAAALERDTMSGYQEFLNAYPNTALAARVRAMLALRREALTWRRACEVNSPPAYWTYMQRYRHGPHFEDARRRLILINAVAEPPPRFDLYEFDVPPPVEHDDFYIDRPFVVFDDADYGAPPPMVLLLPPRPEIIYVAPPPPPYAGLLPLPLVAAPLLFALPAVRAGLFHAPAAVIAQQPGANEYYSNRYAHPPAAGGAPQAAPGAPATGPAGRPLPAATAPIPAGPAAVAPVPAAPAPISGAAPVNHALPHGGVPPVAPSAAAPVAPPAPGAGPAAHALPHGLPTANAPTSPTALPATAAKPALNGAAHPPPSGGGVPHTTAGDPGSVAPVAPAQAPPGHLPAAHVSPGQRPAAHLPPAPKPAAPVAAIHAAPPAPAAVHAAPIVHAPAPHPSAPHVAPTHAAPPQAAVPHMPPPQAAAPRPAAPPHIAAPQPAAARPAPPPQHAAPPQAPHPQGGGHPHCGGPGEPPCH